MSGQAQISASEVMRQIEGRLSAAAYIRGCLCKLAEIAVLAEQEAHAVAASALGADAGATALQLAKALLPSPEAVTAEDLPPHIAAEIRKLLLPQSGSPVAPAPAEQPAPQLVQKSAEAPAPAAQDPQPSRPEADAGEARIEIAGFLIPARRQEEAAKLETQAAELASSRKPFVNPYIGDRGKNAWRPKLCREAYLRACAKLGLEPIMLAQPDPVQAAVQAPAVPALQNRELAAVQPDTSGEPVLLPEDFPEPEEPEFTPAAPDESDDGDEPETPPVRRPGLGVPLSAPTGLKLPAAQPRKTASVPPQPPRPPGFLRKRS